jgi:predicted transcriptional regulator
MKRTTIKISDELDAKLRHEAERRGVTISEVTREALESYLGGNGPRRHLMAAAAGRSGYTDTAARIEEILAEEWSDPRSS